MLVWRRGAEDDRLGPFALGLEDIHSDVIVPRLV